MGQIIESALSNIAIEKGCITDGTTFRKIDIDELVEEAKKYGLDSHGYQRLYNGYDGNWIDAMIFTGNVFYQRLQKFVAKSVYSIDVGPTDIITRQPLDGKANQGGLRISELQRDVLFSHGAARFFTEKFFEDSDDFEIYFCRCGARAIVNHHVQIYRCLECKDNADIYAIYSSWSSKITFQELGGMHIGTTITLAPHLFFE